MRVKKNYTLAKKLILTTLLFFYFGSCFATASESHIDTDVVVIVDTSVSMKEPGMDPERVSLLVSKLLNDVVPGTLSYIRLLDLSTDGSLLPSKPTGKKGECPENAAEMCSEVEAEGDWSQMAYDNTFGMLTRPTRGDAGFKRELETHLEQRSGNSQFHLAFSSARGKLKNAKGDNKHIIWLSDGRTDHEPPLLREITKAKQEDIQVEAIVFGAGDTRLAKQAGLPSRQIHSPAELMKAIADIFRKVVHAPYDVSSVLTSSPNFEMLPHIKEAWVIVYGDETLSGATLQQPNGKSVNTSFAQDSWAGAGAYRVAYIENPEEGEWVISATEGGVDVAYAVIQNSSLYPFLERPEKAFLDTETSLVATIKSGNSAAITNKRLTKDSQIHANIEGKSYLLNDDGRGGDEKAGDGLFSGVVVFRKEGGNRVELTLKNDYTNRISVYSVEASGSFLYTGESPFKVDFGQLTHNSKVCQEVILKAKHKGVISFEQDVIHALPAEHSLFASTSENPEKLSLKPNEPFNLCLQVSETAPSSSIEDEELFLIKVANGTASDQQVIFSVSWEVEGLSFLERWLLLLLLILGLIALIIIALGYILPKRFQSTLHIAMGADLEELEEFVPMQLKRMPKVGIGFYRNAQAYIHDDFRVMGTGKSASVRLSADVSEARVQAINGRFLRRKNAYQEWERIEESTEFRSGEVIQVGDGGLYFKLLDR